MFLGIETPDSTTVASDHKRQNIRHPPEQALEAITAHPNRRLSVRQVLPNGALWPQPAPAGGLLERGGGVHQGLQVNRLIARAIEAIGQDGVGGFNARHGPNIPFERIGCDGRGVVAHPGLQDPAPCGSGGCGWGLVFTRPGARPSDLRPLLIQEHVLEERDHGREQEEAPLRWAQGPPEHLNAEPRPGVGSSQAPPA
ncbi:hypothetical protein [Cyanobium sp. Morenito 9A2]|uniref:hypothetical protein n=1 Tax=Cyanobium sp. Morenito 9A2 TaxID=2823718 RepID=UPI0020CE2B39|nr:hypothetical protein [Cyanobium sp. Morenito 9A2]MCP9848622.1 hypothetical protein [Cyanobium sp. Morenito 9A2]